MNISLVILFPHSAHSKRVSGQYTSKCYANSPDLTLMPQLFEQTTSKSCMILLRHILALNSFEIEALQTEQRFAMGSLT